MGRAVAHLEQLVPRFRDPTALPLLPPEARVEVERFCAGERPKSPREGFQRGRLRALADVMVVRSLAIDDVVARAAAPQLVILGAGLDGRAFRMPELRDSVVYEVDHPDTQRDKRARVGALRLAAREHRFVPVDFTRDSLDAALLAAGHDTTQPTTWVWEGVVMYLTPAEVSATLEVIARRSAPKSTLVLLYSCPAVLLSLVAFFVKRLGEPFRSRFTRDEMRVLLERHGFRATDDADIAELARRLGPPLDRRARLMHHLRFVAAERV